MPDQSPLTLEPVVSHLEYRTTLSPADRDAILALPFTLKNLERNAHIVRERELATHTCVMLSGYSIRSKIVATGKRQILAIHMKGDLVDLQNSLLEVADHSVQMLTAGKVALIRREDIVRLASDHPAVGRALWLDTLVDASIFREWIANVGRRDARTRIAHLLCEFSLRLDLAGLAEEDGYTLPMSQEKLADTTGLTSVHVNRTMRKLEQEGLIERATPRSIVIGAWQRLADVGDFDSNYLHLRKNSSALAF